MSPPVAVDRDPVATGVTMEAQFQSYNNTAAGDSGVSEKNQAIGTAPSLTWRWLHRNAFQQKKTANEASS